MRSSKQRYQAKSSQKRNQSLVRKHQRETHSQTIQTTAPSTQPCQRESRASGARGQRVQRCRSCILYLLFPNGQRQKVISKWPTNKTLQCNDEKNKVKIKTEKKEESRRRTINLRRLLRLIHPKRPLIKDRKIA